MAASVLDRCAKLARIAATGESHTAIGGVPDGRTEVTGGRGGAGDVAESQHPFMLLGVDRSVPPAEVATATSKQRGV